MLFTSSSILVANFAGTFKERRVPSYGHPASQTTGKHMVNQLPEQNKCIYHLMSLVPSLI